MATKLDDKQTVRVRVSQTELTNLLIQPAKDLGFIDFDPTRVGIDKEDTGNFVIVFERVETGP